METPSVNAKRSAPALLQLGMGFQSSRVILSAVELDLFTLLHDKPQSADEIRRRLDLHPRSVCDFLDCLLALGALDRLGTGADAAYCNTDAGQRLLSKKSTAYCGERLVQSSKRLYAAWGELTNVLRSGSAGRNGTASTPGYFFNKLYDTEVEMRGFMRMMASMNSAAHAAFAERFDFTRYSTLLDVGGALGTLCCLVAQKHGHMNCTTMDLGIVEGAAREYVRDKDVEQKVTVISGDFFKDALQRADVITMAHILHSHSVDNRTMLMSKAFDALPDGGALVVIEMLIDDERQAHVDGLLMALSMAVLTSEGGGVTGREMEQWAKDIGFRSVHRMELKYPTFAVVCCK